MFNLPEDKNAGCQRLLEALESVPTNKVTSEEVMLAVSAADQEHVRSCDDCNNALSELVMARLALLPLRANATDDRPWFTKRVMAAIAAKEREIEESNRVWVNVRRFAPRLVAFCALLLVVGSTWALQLRKAEEARRASVQQAEGLFDPGSSAPVSDDANSIFGTGEARP
jgi:type VI protein secretion system component VasK